MECEVKKNANFVMMIISRVFHLYSGPSQMEKGKLDNGSWFLNKWRPI